MLSAAGLAAIHAQPTAVRTADTSAVAGLSPAQVAHAYGFDQLGTFAGKAANGAGQTIAIVNAFDDATIKCDLNAFDGKFGLPALQPGQFQVVNQQGGNSLPSPSPRGDDWTEETSLDVEWAHAMAPWREHPPGRGQQRRFQRSLDGCRLRRQPVGRLRQRRASPSSP